MRELTVILVTDLTNKCDLFIYDYSYSSNDYNLVSSLMKKAIDKVASSELNLSLRSTFSDMIDDTPLEYGLKFRSFKCDASLEMFIDSEDIVSSVLLCDLSTSASTDKSIPSWPALYNINKHDAKYKDLSITKSMRDFATDVIVLGSRKLFTEHKLYSVSSDDSIIELPSFGSIEKFKRIARASCLKTERQTVVRHHLYDSKTNSSFSSIAHLSRFISKNHIEECYVDIDEIDESSAREEDFRTDHFELKIDDKDYLRLNCAKIDTKVDDRGVNLLASFYLTDQTSVLLDSILFKIGSIHGVEILLYSPDKSKIIKSGKADFKIDSISYKCDYTVSKPILIEVLFRSIKNSD